MKRIPTVSCLRVFGKNIVVDKTQSLIVYETRLHPLPFADRTHS